MKKTTLLSHNIQELTNEYILLAFTHSCRLSSTLKFLLAISWHASLMNVHVINAVWFSLIIFFNISCRYIKDQFTKIMILIENAIETYPKCNHLK